MTAQTRWVEYPVNAATSTYLGASTSGVGTRGQVEADSSVGDNFDIGPTTSVLSLKVDTEGSYHEITLTSGIELDARFVARDITEKMHALRQEDDSWAHATCRWENNEFHIYSGNIGSDFRVDIQNITNSAHITLGFETNTPTQGSNHSYDVNNYNGGISVSGTWEGMFDEEYTILITNANTIGSPGGTHSYNGAFTTGGQFNNDNGLTYTITVSCSGSQTTGGGTGHVPTFTWDSDGSADTGGPVEILYPNHWYNVGVHGLKVKWSDDIFGDGDVWTIACTKPQYAHSTDVDTAVGIAEYFWTSNRGDECGSAITTSDTEYTQVGTRGASIKFIGGSNNLKAGDEFRIVCRGPQPVLYGITSLMYGNVTVTEESPVKCVLFEIMSGAVMMDVVRFGLQNHGSFSYHKDGGDTYFRFGTIGAAEVAGAGTTTGKEWRTNVTADDL